MKSKKVKTGSSKATRKDSLSSGEAICRSLRHGYLHIENQISNFALD
jgi:hypothetical protein